MIGFSEESETKLQTAINLLDQIGKIGLSALDKFPTDKYSFENFTFITYLERFTFGIASINIQLKNFKDHIYLETSIGLNLRAHLLDFLVVTYLLSYQTDIKSKDDIESKRTFDKQFNSVLTDQLFNSIKYVKLSKANGVINTKQYRQIIENLWYTYHFLFIDPTVDYDKPESKLISKEFKSPKQYFERINSHPIVKPYSGAYDLYTYYSKYEHFGIITYATRRY